MLEQVSAYPVHLRKKKEGGGDMKVMNCSYCEP